MDFSNSPWLLVLQHKYYEAIEIYHEWIREGRLTATIYAELGTAYLCADAAHLASGAFEQAEILSSRSLPQALGRSDAHLFWLGGSLLVEGKPHQSATVLSTAVTGISNGTISRTDIAGGASIGSLLGYAAKIADDHAKFRDAQRFMKGLSRRKRSENWPGPLMGLYLGITTPSIVLSNRFGTDQLSEIAALSRDDLSLRRAAATALFHVGHYHEAQDDHPAATEAYEVCANLENPILAVEWYLARKRVSDGVPSS